MASSKLGLRLWAITIYLFHTNLKGVSSLHLSRELGITQHTAWFLNHRIREAFAGHLGLFSGSVEIDETPIGGKQKNMHHGKKIKGRGSVGKFIVVGINERESNQVAVGIINRLDHATPHRFVRLRVDIRRVRKIYTDEYRAYARLPAHGIVNHKRKEYVKGEIHTNGIDSFWVALKRGYYGTNQVWSKKHLHRYLNEFSGRPNLRPLDTLEQMAPTVAGMEGKRLRYCDLVA